MREYVRHIYFVGIGGAGMSGIAQVLINQGYRVSGSDLAESAVTEQLSSQGARSITGMLQRIYRVQMSSSFQVQLVMIILKSLQLAKPKYR